MTQGGQETDEVKLPHTAQVWSVKVDGNDLNYGNIHEIIHRDISIGNGYRTERIKLLTALATGVFALTATFHKDFLGGSTSQYALAFVLLGWVALLGSLFAGIMHFGKWEDYYIEHRELGLSVWKFHASSDAKLKREARDAFNKSRTKIGDLRQSYRKWNLIQSGGLLLGLLFIGLYVIISINTAKTSAAQAPAPHPVHYEPKKLPSAP